MDTQHLAAFRTQACQIVIPSQSYLGIAMKFTLYLIMAYTGQFLGKGPATKSDEFLEKFQTAFDPLPPLIFGNFYHFFSENPCLKPCIKVQNLQYRFLD